MIISPKNTRILSEYTAFDNWALREIDSERLTGHSSIGLSPTMTSASRLNGRVAAVRKQFVNTSPYLERGPEACAQVGYIPERPPRLPLDHVPWPAQKRRRLLTKMGSALCRPPEPRLRPTF